MEDPFIFQIVCIIFLLQFINVIRMSLPVLPFLAKLHSKWNSLPGECFSLTYDPNGVQRHPFSLGCFQVFVIMNVDCLIKFCQKAFLKCISERVISEIHLFGKTMRSWGTVIFYISKGVISWRHPPNGNVLLKMTVSS